jgi:PilZ domain
MTDLQPLADTAVATTDDQRRAAKRQRVLKAGKIVLDNLTSIACTIRDVSETGAKVRVDESNAVPHKFRLVILADNTIRDAQIAWKRDGEIGVNFTSAAKSSALRKF